MARVELRITGMHCASCAALVTETLVELPGVAGADVELAAGLARVDHDPAVVSVAGLCDAVVATGYVAAPAGADGSC